MIRVILIGLLLAFSPLPAVETFVYAKRESGDLLLDVHYPTAKSKAPHPVIFWTHGGGWRQGSKANYKLVEWLLDEGYAIISINYRLTDVAHYPSQWEDCSDAINWVNENGLKYQLDRDHIITAGLSAGAHLASLIATKTSEADTPIQGVMHFYGPADFTQLAKYAKNPADTLNTQDSPIYGLLGGPLRENLKLAKEASPVSYLDSMDPPFLILVGKKDSLMTQRQCKRLHEAALSVDVRSTLHEIEDAGHGGKQFSDPTRQKIILKFLNSIQP